MSTWTDLFTLGLVLTSFRLLASSRLAALIGTMTMQAMFLTAIPLTVSEGSWSVGEVALLAIILIIKGGLLPWLLLRAMRVAEVRREVEPFIGYSASVLAGMALFVLSFLITHPLQVTIPSISPLLFPGALFTTLTGLVIIVSRRKALTQVVGYLAMENGIYAFGAALSVEAPLIVEMGILLDVFVAVFVMGIIIFHINKEFDHIDTDRLWEVKH